MPISNQMRLIYGICGALILSGSYLYLSHRQHNINPTDTTIPTIQQLLGGIKEICAFHSDNDLMKAFGIEVEEDSIFKKIGSTRIWQDSFATYGRLFKGIILGCIFSTIIGLYMGCYEWLAAFLLPPLSFLSKVPGTAMLAVFFVLVGTGELMFIVMIGFGILPTLTQSIYLSSKNDIHEQEVNKAYTLGASNVEVIWNVVFQQITPAIIDSIRLQFGPAMVYLIAAEMLVGQVGMGYTIRMQQRLLNMSIVYDYIIILGITGLMMDRAMSYIRSYLCPWYVRMK